MRTEAIRNEVSRLMRQTPFRPFMLNLENGERLVIGHPENIAFHPEANGGSEGNDFYVISGRIRYFGTFDAVTGVAIGDTGK